MCSRLILAKQHSQLFWRHIDFTNDYKCCWHYGETKRDIIYSFHYYSQLTVISSLQCQVTETEDCEKSLSNVPVYLVALLLLSFEDCIMIATLFPGVTTKWMDNFVTKRRSQWSVQPPNVSHLRVIMWLHCEITYII